MEHNEKTRTGSGERDDVQASHNPRQGPGLLSAAFMNQAERTSEEKLSDAGEDEERRRRGQDGTMTSARAGDGGSERGGERSEHQTTQQGNQRRLLWASGLDPL